ncbi:MAG: HD domain-containing protein [Deltaproteobacteria bacterium]|nr:HD domain-containing protein [Deltaproteobacteria bacterium]
MKDAYGKMLKKVARLGNMSDLDDVIKTSSILLKNIADIRWALVYFFDKELQGFTPARGYGLPQRYIRLFENTPLHPDKLPVLKSMLLRKQHLLITDTVTSDMVNPTYRRFLRDVTLLAVPMIVRNQVLGTIFVARSTTLPPFTEKGINLIKDMAANAALSVSHMRHYDETLDTAINLAKRVDTILTLDEINKAISSSLSREKIFEKAIQGIERIIPCAMVMIIQEEKSEIVITASHWREENVAAALHSGARLSLYRSTAGNAMKTGKSVSIESLGSKQNPGHLDRILSEAGIATLLAVPLVSRDTARGALLLGDRQPGGFATEEIFVIEKIASQISVALENALLYEDMRNLFISTVSSLANAIDAKSPWTKGHSERVMNIAAKIAEEMGLSDLFVEQIKIAGLLHDIGKIGILEELLEKPDKISDEEFPPMRLHPEKGVAILAPIEQLQDILPAIRHHHERYDGTGYPDGLKGEEIPLQARIVAVADAFDAMVSDRPYKKGFSVQKALKVIEMGAGSQFDPFVVECFRNKVADKLPLLTKQAQKRH